MAKQREILFSEFQAPTRQEWLDKIEVDLKGADFNKKLVWRTNEGFNVQPFYMREDLDGLKTPDSLPGEFPFVRGNKKDSNAWYVRQQICAECPKEANEKALDVLNKGVDSLAFFIPKEKVSIETIETLLEGIVAEAVELNFKTCPCACVELAQILVAYFEKKGYDKKNIAGAVEFDPIEKMVMQGKAKAEEKIALTKQLVEIFKDYPKFRCVCVDVAALANAGAYITQELGYALAWGNEYLNQMVEAGVSPALAARKIKFNMGISTNFFMEMAKFRAARLLWANIVKQYEPICDCGSDCQCEKVDGKYCPCACKMNVTAFTSKYYMTLFDSYVNLLRTQTESMSACLAGVDAIVVTPFDAVYEKPSDFSERIARNQQLLLKEESHFDKVVDPGAGSYYIEELTVSIANEAWKKFLAVEEAGGFLAQVKAGAVQDDINATNAKRHDDAAKRKEFMLGTNQFPNFTEASEGKEAMCCCCCKGECEAPELKTIKPTRLSSDFEALRQSVEKSGKQPVAFMLTIGNLAMRQARAQFSCNFLACAGYKVIDNLGFETVEAGVDAALAAKADIVVLCSSDDEYAEYSVPAFKYLNGRALFVVAGAPACMEDLQKEGIENFIHVRSNVLETLKSYNTKLGI